MIDQKIALKQFEKIEKRQGEMRLAAEGWSSPYQILISTILSARTLDETTIRVCQKLFARYPTVYSLGEAEILDIEEMIRSINFYKNKSKNIIACANDIIKNHNGIIPLEYAPLITLPGVGNKTANVFLSEMGKPTIGVDTHVYYISRYLGWSTSTKPELVEKDLQNLFPQNYWNKLNSTLVKFGKKYTSRKEKNKILEEIKRIGM